MNNSDLPSNRIDRVLKVCLSKWILSFQSRMQSCHKLCYYYCLIGNNFLDHFWISFNIQIVIKTYRGFNDQNQGKG